MSGLDIGDTLSESTQVTSPLGFSLALLLIGQEGKVMILEQDTVLVLEWKQKLVLPFSDPCLACHDVRPDTGLPTRDAGIPIVVRLRVTVCAFVVVLAMCLQVTTTHGKSTIQWTDRAGCLGP